MNRSEAGPWISRLLVLVAIVIFVLVGLDVTVLDAGGVRLAAWGLAAFAAAHLVP